MFATKTRKYRFEVVFFDGAKIYAVAETKVEAMSKAIATRAYEADKRVMNVEQKELYIG